MTPYLVRRANEEMIDIIELIEDQIDSIMDKTEHDNLHEHLRLNVEEVKAAISWLKENMDEPKIGVFEYQIMMIEDEIN